MVEQAFGVKMPIHIAFGYISADFHDDPLGISFNADSSFLLAALRRSCFLSDRCC